MYLQYLFICLLLSESIIAGNKHTKLYKERGINNDNNYYYDPKTYGGNVYSDSSLVIHKNNAFRKELNSRFSCQGSHCINGQYVCERTGNIQCYHVEHIIDANGPEFPDCQQCKNV